MDWNSVLSGASGAALFAGVFSLITWLLNRSATNADKKEQKADKMAEKEDKLDRLTKMVESLAENQASLEKQVDALREAQKCVLLDRVIWLGQGYIRAGEIDVNDRRRLREMHQAYHEGLGGNGDADAIMKQIDALPLKIH